jgi:site-specific DNA-methyltransferase (adenine-specific)
MKQHDEEQLKQVGQVIYSLPAAVRRELLESAARYLVAEGRGDQLSLLGLEADESGDLRETAATPVRYIIEQTQANIGYPKSQVSPGAGGNVKVEGTDSEGTGATPISALPFLNQVVHGDSLELLQQLPAKSVDVMITSPPYYKQRDYGGGLGNEGTIDAYVENLLNVFELCATAVKQTGSLFVNMGDKYEEGSLLLVPYLFAGKAVERTGVKLINVITWVKPNPEPRQYKRRLVSSTEPIFHFVKSDDYCYYPDHFLAQRDVVRSGVKAGNNVGKKYFELVEQSDLSEEQKKMAKEEIQQAIQEVKSGAIASFRMKIRGIHSEAYGGNEGGRKGHLRTKGFTIIRMYDRSMKRDVIECPILSIKALKHPAVYPEFLVQELLNLTTLPGDVVLDPFLGSGTTAVVAKRMKRHFIGFEINQEYCESAMARIGETTVQPTLTEFYV